MLDIFCFYCYIGFIVTFMSIELKDFRFFPYDKLSDKFIHILLAIFFMAIYVLFWPFLLVLRHIN